MLFRIIKMLMLAAIATFFTLITTDNIMAYQENWQFVQHVLAMDTTFKDPAIMWRAITMPHLQTFIYNAIIVWEGLTALICWMGALNLLRHHKSQQEIFVKAKRIGIMGLFMGFWLYFFGFIIVGGEWFAMWQSSIWNGQAKAGLFCSMILFVMIFLTQQE